MGAMRVSPRRLALLLAALGTAGALVTGVTLAMPNSVAGEQGNSMANGTVVLGAVGSTSPQGQTCTIPALSPGQASTGFIPTAGETTSPQTLPPCVYSVRYDGTLAGWVGLDVLVTNGGTALYTGGNTGLQLQITDSYGNSFTPDMVNQVLKRVGPSDANADGSVDALWTDTFTVNYALPSNTSGSFHNATASIQLVAHAVQESNDPMEPSCASPALGWNVTPPSSGPCGSGTPGTESACQTQLVGGVIRGCTAGFWSNRNGNAAISADGVNLRVPVMLGEVPRGFQLTTLAESNTVLPPGDACASTVLDCGSDFSSGITANTVDQLASQTLALAYNIQYVPGYSGETVAQLGCGADLSGLAAGTVQLTSGSSVPLNLSSSSTVNAVLFVADALIGGSTSRGNTNQTEAGAMAGLLGSCLNVE